MKKAKTDILSVSIHNNNENADNDWIDTLLNTKNIFLFTKILQYHG